jgi:hypothetical protein
MTGNGREDESRRERKKASIKNKEMLDRFEDSERLLQQCPKGKGNKNFTSFFLFLTWICQWR